MEMEERRAKEREMSCSDGTWECLLRRGRL